MIKMQATCDPVGGDGNYQLWRVTVTSEGLQPQTYTIEGGSDGAAVSEAMRRFQAEFEK